MVAATQTFGPEYARIYDAIYAGKDYARECDLVESAFRQFASVDVRSLLDIGCGTGNHALPLAARGYHVTGVDLSVGMLALARAKAARAGATVRLIAGDARCFDARARYDAALMMFAVIGYMRTDDGVRDALANIRRHLRPGGLLVFDAWYGPGVLADPPRARVTTIEIDGAPLTREVSSVMDGARHLGAVHYRLLDARGGAISEETHVVRYFFPREIEMALQVSGLRLRRLSALDDPARKPDARDWNALVVAEAV